MGQISALSVNAAMSDVVTAISSRRARVYLHPSPTQLRSVPNTRFAPGTRVGALRARVVPEPRIWRDGRVGREPDRFAIRVVSPILSGPDPRPPHPEVITTSYITGSNPRLRSLNLRL